MLVKTDYKDRNNSIYKCDMCDKEIKNKHITRYQKFIYSNKSRYSRFTNIDKEKNMFRREEDLLEILKEVE